MLKSGDVFVAEEKRLAELAIGEVVSDVRKGKAAAKRLIEEADEAPPDLVVVRVERIARGAPIKPRFAAAFDDEEGTPAPAPAPSEG